MHAGRRLFAHAANFLGGLAVPARLFDQPLLDRGEQHLLLLVVGMVKHGRSQFRLRAEMHQQRGVATIIEDHVRGAAVGPFENAVGVFPVIVQRLALDRENRRAAGGHGCGGVVLCRVDVAGGPAHVGAERLERIDQHGGLNGHVQRTRDARAAQRLFRAVFVARCHQAGHFGFGYGKFFLTPFGEAKVLDDIIGLRSFSIGRGAHDTPWQWSDRPCAFWEVSGWALARSHPSARGTKDIKIALCLSSNADHGIGTDTHYLRHLRPRAEAHATNGSPCRGRQLALTSGA